MICFWAWWDRRLEGAEVVYVLVVIGGTSGRSEGFVCFGGDIVTYILTGDVG